MPHCRSLSRMEAVPAVSPASASSWRAQEIGSSNARHKTRRSHPPHRILGRFPCHSRACCVLLTLLLELFSGAAPAQGWTEIPGTGSVSNGGTAAFDQARLTAVFAGFGSPTLICDGTTVVASNAIPRPGPTLPNVYYYLPNLTYDPRTQRVVGLVTTHTVGFGVDSSTVSLVEWDGTSWQYRPLPGLVFQTYSPFFACHDPAQNRLLAYTNRTGTTSTGTFSIDTAQATPQVVAISTPRPQADDVVGVFADPSTQSPTLCALTGVSSSPILRTYRWTGNQWAQDFPTWPFAPFPSPAIPGSNFAGSTSASGAMCFRYTIDATSSSVAPRTIQLAGGRCSELFLSSYPPEGDYTTVWDPHRSCFYAAGDAALNVWQLSLGPDAQASTLGVGCPGTRGTPTLAPQQGSTPRIGTNFILQSLNLPLSGHVFLALGASDTFYGPTPLPLNLAPLGATQCNLLVSIDNLFPTSNILGAATWGFTIPNIPGGVFFTQTIVFDPPANAFGVTLSNAVRGVVGS